MICLENMLIVNCLVSRIGILYTTFWVFLYCPCANFEPEIWHRLLPITKQENSEELKSFAEALTPCFFCKQKIVNSAWFQVFGNI